MSHILLRAAPTSGHILTTGINSPDVSTPSYGGEMRAEGNKWGSWCVGKKGDMGKRREKERGRWVYGWKGEDGDRDERVSWGRVADKVLSSARQGL